MSIEHNLIPAGEQHVVANWQVATVPDLDNLSVTFDDIGKQAWVQGIGHFTLANSDPITWEGSSASISSFTYTAGTKLLTLTDSTGATYTATIDGLTTAEVAALITAHSGAADPHGDRAFSVQRANHTGTQTASTISDFAATASAAAPVQSVFGRTGAVVAQAGDYTASDVGAQALDATLTALAGLNATPGFVVQVGVDNFTKRTLTGTAGQITITHGAGDTGIPTFSLASTGVTAGTYGSASLIPVPVIDAQGRITSISTVAPAATVLTEANFSVAKTGQPTFTVTWVLTALTAARAWTVPNAAINFGDLSAVATTDSNTLSGTRTRIVGGQYNTVSGTDNVAIGCVGAGSGASSVILDGTGTTAINSEFLDLSGTGNTVINALGVFGTRFVFYGTDNVAIGCSGFNMPRTGNNNNTYLGCSGFINPTGSHEDIDYCGALNVQFYGSVGNPNTPDFSRRTLLGMGGNAFKALQVLTGSHAAAGNVDLVGSGSKKPIALTAYVTDKVCTHYIRLCGSGTAAGLPDGFTNLNRIVTAEYKVTARGTGSGVLLGTVQTIVAPFADLGTPSLTPTVTITVTGAADYKQLLNINVSSADATRWSAVVESYYHQS